MKTCTLASIATMLLGACGVDGADITSLGITVRFSAELLPEQIFVTARDGHNSRPFEPVLLPEDPTERMRGGKASLVVLLPDELDGETLAVRVDGMVGGGVVGSGGDLVVVRRDALAGVRVFLGAPADCGDGIVRTLLEDCDDANLLPDDGCDATCTLEPGFVCTTAAANGPSICTPEM